MSERHDTGTGRVLLTGASGFVGSRVARKLAAAGRRVRAIVRKPGTAPADPGIEEIVGEFSDPGTARAAAAGVEAVVHAAATSGPELDPVRRVNTDGTRVMVEATLAAGVRRFVQISTVSVYARGRQELLDEDAPLKTEGDPYGLTKAEADRLVLEAMERGLPAVILRPGAVLGLHPTSTWAVIVPSRIRDGQVKLRGDGREIIPWVHVEDLCDAVLLALADSRATGRVYNVADGEMTWREYTDEVRGWLAAPPLEETPIDEFGGYWMGRFDASRIRRELGYRPRHSFQEGMGEAAEYWMGERASRA